jgi:hypothetical protein
MHAHAGDELQYIAEPEEIQTERAFPKIEGIVKSIQQ